MAGGVARAVATTLSVLAGLVAGWATNVLTDAWSWTWAAALAVTAVVLVVSQVWLTAADPSNDVVATGRGAVAAGRRVDGDVEVDVSGFPAGSPAPQSGSGVTAAGDGAVAAGRDVRGRLRLRVRRH